MEARPNGEGVQWVVGRNRCFSGCDELRFLLDVVHLAARCGTISSVLGFEP